MNQVAVQTRRDLSGSGEYTLWEKTVTYHCKVCGTTDVVTQQLANPKAAEYRNLHLDTTGVIKRCLGLCFDDSGIKTWNNDIESNDEPQGQS